MLNFFSKNTLYIIKRIGKIIGANMKRLFFLTISLTVILLFFSVQCSKPGSSSKETKKKAGKETAEKDKGKEAETDAVPVQVTTPTSGDISSFLLFSSNIDSEKVVDIYPMTYGIIEKINTDEGRQVKKGDVLAVLDEREASINEKKANINYRKLIAEFERQQKIYQGEMLSKEEFEKFKFTLETAKLEWEQKKLLLSYTRITSPISGVVTKRYIKVGNKIDTSQLAFSVVQDKEKIAVVNIPEQEIDALFIKQKAIVFSGAKQTPGFVKRISPVIDPESGTFKVTVEVDDKDGIFAVGQFVNVKVVKKVHKNALLLVKDAIIYDGGKVFVFVVNKDNEAVKKQLKLGFEEGSRVEVVEGLSENERVVTAGKSSLKHKTLVKIIEPVVS